MRARYPNIRLRLMVGYAGHLLDWIEKGDVDIALLYGQKETPTMQFKALVDEVLWVVARATARLSLKRPIPLARVAQQPFVLPGPPQGLRTLIEHAATEAGVVLDVVAETNALSVQKALVAEGQGWTSLPAVSVKQAVESGELSAAQLAATSLRRTIVLAAPAARQVSAPVRCVVAPLMEQVRAAFDAGHWGPGTHWIGH